MSEWSRGVCLDGVEEYVQRSRGVFLGSRGVFLEEQSSMSRGVEEYFQRSRVVCLEEQRSISRGECLEEYVQRSMSRGVCLEEQRSMSRGVEEYIQRRKGVCLSCLPLAPERGSLIASPGSQFGRALHRVAHDYPTGEQRGNHWS